VKNDWLEALRDANFEVIETSLSWVFLGAHEVWKIKKALSIGSMDCRTLEKRKIACDAEFEQHRLLAPGVYREVVALRRRPGGGYGFGGDGEIVDWAIRMKRLPQRERGDDRLGEGRLVHGQLDAVAAHLKHFHAASEVSSEARAFADPGKLSEMVEANFTQDRDYLESYLGPREVGELAASLLNLLREREELFAERIAKGFIRHIHGDPRLENVYVGESGEVAIVDRLEFGDHFLWADTCSDVAALSMDLSCSGRADLAEYFLASYADCANDFDLFPLVDFYEAFRAYLLGKLHAALAGHVDVDVAGRSYAGRKARRYFLYALSKKRRPLLPPVVVAMSGLVASGKSTVAKAVARDIASPIVLSDHTRDALVSGHAHGADAGAALERAFAPGFPEEVYTEVLRRAEQVLRSSRPVVIDGCFGTRAWRARVRELAQKAGVPFLFVECRCPRELAWARLRERAQEAAVPVRAWIDLYEQFEKEWEPVSELPAQERVVLDTSLALESNVARLRERLAHWPEGLTQ